MRISSSTMYDSGVLSMQQQTAQLMHTQQQLSSGRRVLTPADDPVAAARVLEVSQSQSINTQYTTNIGSASDSLGLEESTLGSVTALLQNVRDVAVNAGDAVLTQSDRASLANELRGNYQELLGLANSTDASGQYLFSGYQGGIRPFSESASGNIVYNGDQGQRLVQVSASRQIAVSDAGANVFQRIPNGNGSFVTTAGAANAGSAVIDAGTVLDASKWNDPAHGTDLSVTFAVKVGVTTYNIVDNGPGGPTVLAGPRAYTSGGNINLGKDGPPAVDFGAQVNISGIPADGDSFAVNASSHQDVFKTINDLADLLQSSSGAALTNGLAAAQRNIDHALDQVSTLRASAGTRLKELDSVKSAGDNRALQYSQTLSSLQDVDYAKAASDLTQQQMNLEAAQKSFAKVAGLSLFNYL